MSSVASPPSSTIMSSGASEPVERLIGAPPVLLERLALPREHVGVTSRDDRGGGVVLRGEDVARAPAHVGAERDERLDEHRGLDGHVERAGDVRALERLGGAELLDHGHEAGHLDLRELDLHATEGRRFVFGVDGVGEWGRGRTSAAGGGGRNNPMIPIRGTERGPRPPASWRESERDETAAATRDGDRRRRDARRRARIDYRAVARSKRRGRAARRRGRATATPRRPDRRGAARSIDRTSRDRRRKSDAGDGATAARRPRRDGRRRAVPAARPRDRAREERVSSESREDEGGAARARTRGARPRRASSRDRPSDAGAENAARGRRRRDRDAPEVSHGHVANLVLATVDGLDDAHSGRGGHLC